MSNKKGEIATILTIGSLIFLGAVSIVSSIFLKKTGKTQPRASGCSQVSVSFSPSSINAGQTFTCKLSGSIINQYTMACGWSKNGGWPLGQISGSCSNNSCTFQVKMEDQVDPNAFYELVGFDMREGCGPSEGSRTNLTVAGVNPQSTQPNCEGRCCDKPNGYIIEPHVRMDCDSNLGRYVIIDKVCQNNQEVDKPGCASCRSCQAGDQPISPVSSYDLAVNECTGGCGQNQGICSGLSDCSPNITPAIIRSCADSSFSCPSGYQGCKKEGAIWCYSGQGRVSTSGGNQPPPPTSTPNQPSPPTNTPTPTEDPFCYYSSFRKCYNIGMCTGSCVKCDNGKYKCTSEITPSKSPPPSSPPTDTSTLTPKSGELGGPCINLRKEDAGIWKGDCNQGLVCNPNDGKCTTPTPTNTPTPNTLPTPTLSSLPDPDKVINTKGTISFFIPFVNNKYYSDYEKFYNYNFLSGFDFLLKRETNCNLFNGGLIGCAYQQSVTKNNDGINILYNNIDRYFKPDQYSLKPNNFYFSALYLENYYEKKSFYFKDYNNTELSFNDLPPVDLAKYYRKVSLRFLKEDGYLYHEGHSIYMIIVPLPVNYSKITNVSFDNNIDIIYIDFYDPLPSSITITAAYSCGNGKMYSERVQELLIKDLNSSENDVGAIPLNCSESQTN